MPCSDIVSSEDHSTDLFSWFVQPRKPSKLMGGFQVGLNTLHNPSKINRPIPNHRDAASASSSRAQPSSSGQPGWGSQNIGPLRAPRVMDGANSQHGTPRSGACVHGKGADILLLPSM